MNRLLRRLWTDERGIALVMALGIMFVFAIATTSVIWFTMSNQTEASNSSASQVAYNLADAELQQAIAYVQDPSNRGNLMESGLLPTTPTSGSPSTWTGGMRFGTYSEGTAQAWGTLLPVSANGLTLGGVWTVTATGTVSYPAGGRTQTITRKVSADLPISPNKTQVLNNDAWKYIYAWATNASGQCDETISNNLTVTASMYVAGNLCLQNNTHIEGAGPGQPDVNLVAKGYVNLGTNQADIGKSTPLTSVEIDNGCYKSGSSYNTVCGKITGFDIYPLATIGGTTIGPPQANFPGWYALASPGPMSPCDATKSTGTWPQFDNDVTSINPPTPPLPNNSIPTVVNLTPDTAYNCITDTGQIAWDPPGTKKAYGIFTVNGTVYFDGSITAGSGTTGSSIPIQYQGEGAIYASGTFLLKNASFCMNLNTSGGKYSCNTSWSGDPILVIATNGVGTGGSDPQSQVPNGDGIAITSSHFQGALYSTHSILVDTNSDAQAPMISGAEIFQNTGGSPFPIFAAVPFGSPGNPIVNFEAGQPQFYRDG